MKRLQLKRLKELLSYNASTGIFIWRVDKSRTAKKGFVAGRINTDGYRQIGIDGRRYLAGGLAWFYMTGRWPSKEIDHKNRSRLDDRFANLRLLTRRQNVLHSRLSPGTTGYVGITWNSSHKKWRAQIWSKGKRIYLGGFDSPKDAALAYDIAALKHHGAFARLNFGAEHVA